MKTVSVKAVNLRVGDVIDGERIFAKHRYYRRNRANTSDKDANIGILIVTPNPAGYDLKTRKFAGHKRVKVKRPNYNMR